MAGGDDTGLLGGLLQAGPDTAISEANWLTALENFKAQEAQHSLPTVLTAPCTQHAQPWSRMQCPRSGGTCVAAACHEDTVC